MACFVVPATEAVVTTIVSKVAKAQEEKNPNTQEAAVVSEHKISLSRKFKWLSNLLWGGSALLAFEHVWHGEVVPYFPFLSAALDAQDFSAMLHEMSTVGVGMAVLVTLVWGGVSFAADRIAKRDVATAKLTKAEARK